MNQKQIFIRIATVDDAEDLLEIYKPYVEQTAITFEYDVPSLLEFRDRIKNTLLKYPYLVAEMNDEIVGYAYAGSFKSRAAYDWSVETSIYVKMNNKGLGIGRKLYEALESYLKVQNITNVNACIAYPEMEDAYLTMDSVLFHEHCGYQMVGKFHNCAYKFNQWYHMVWMEKYIGPHEIPPKPVIKFEDCINHSE